MKDIEALIELPDNLRNRLNNHLMLNAIQIPSVGSSESKPEQTRPYKSKRNAKQSDINRERKNLEQAIINALILDEENIHNLDTLVRLASTIEDRWESSMINLWLMHRKFQIKTLESVNRIQAIAPSKGGVDGILANLTKIAFTEVIKEIKTSNDKDVKFVENTHNFIRVTEQNLKSMLESMGLLETIMKAESPSEMVEIQKTLMLQKDFHSMKTQQEQVKLVQEQEKKKVRVSFYKRASKLAKTIEFITKMKAPLEMIHNAEKFKESVVQQSIGHLPLTPILNKMQDIQKVSAEKIQSDTGALVHSDIKEGGELEDKLKQEISEALSTRNNEEGLGRHHVLLDNLITKMKQMHIVFLSQNTISYGNLLSESLWNDVAILYENLTKRYRELSGQLKEETNALSKILDEGERRQKISHMNEKFRKEISDFMNKISAMNKEMDRYETMLRSQAKSMDKMTNNTKK
jgi:hypothetical protein